MSHAKSAEKVVQDIRRKTRRRFSAFAEAVDRPLSAPSPTNRISVPLFHVPGQIPGPGVGEHQSCIAVGRGLSEAQLYRMDPKSPQRAMSP